MVRTGGLSEELADLGRLVVDANKYLCLSTADESGLPWASPVHYTPDGYQRFLWVSSPDTQHSRNIAARPEVAIAIFDSSVRIGGAEAVYLRAVARLVPDEELDSATGVYSARFDELAEFTSAQLRPPAPFRLYEANVTEQFVLIRGGDQRFGRGHDSREPVDLST
ncbi:MAG: pyridoxamine 5-phosphate oxidase-related FMN-binding protein [Nocardioides sp.]|nr:pyridoxamine 5-phosphate oxidase-related FMN-binding protein [Nocardioides sp.]